MPFAGCETDGRTAKRVPKFSLSPEALDDLDAISAYIARDNPEAAERVIDAAYRVCAKLAEHPELGPARRFPGDHPHGIGYFVIPDFPNYLIFYRTAAAGVEVIRVLHGMRDIDALFS